MHDPVVITQYKEVVASVPQQIYAYG